MFTRIGDIGQLRLRFLQAECGHLRVVLQGGPGDFVGKFRFFLVGVGGIRCADEDACAAA